MAGVTDSMANATADVTAFPVIASRDVRTPVELGLELGSLVFISVIGIPGNVLVLSAICIARKLRTAANFFLFNLSIADLMICTMVIPMLVPTRLYRMWLFGDDACVLQAFINFLSLYASLFFLASVAVNRCVAISLPHKYKSAFTPNMAGIIIGCVWGMAFVCAVLPALGWGRYEFDPVRDNCLFNRQAAPSYSIFMATVGIALPLATCAVSYVLIIINFRRSRRQVRVLAAGGGRPPQSQNTVSQDDIRLTKNLFAVWLAFFVCWAPMNIMLFMDPKGQLPRTAYVVSIWLLLFNSCLNPIIYGLANKHFREGYRQVFRCLLRKNATVAPSQEGRADRTQRSSGLNNNNNNNNGATPAEPPRPPAQLQPRDS